MENNKDLKNEGLSRYFEEIIGREIPAPEAGEVTITERVASYMVNPGFITSREIGTTGSSTKGCQEMNLLDVGGAFRTDSEGKVEFLLSDFFCNLSNGSAAGFLYPVNIVATPRLLTPIFISAHAAPASAGSDVSITVATFKADGTPAPNIPFGFRCLAPFVLIEG